MKSTTYRDRRLQSFSTFIVERDAGVESSSTPSDEHPFEKNKSIGWWDDPSKTHIDVYHGTHERNLESIKMNGLNKSDQRTGMVSVTPDPHTAHAYASMSGSGGEASFRGASQKPANTPHHQRVTVKFSLPREWVHANVDPHLHGNIGIAANKMHDANTYHSWKASNPTKSDSEYYGGTEIRLQKPIPPEYYAGFSRKVKL